MRPVEHSPRGVQGGASSDSVRKPHRQKHTPLPRAVAKVGTPETATLHRVDTKNIISARCVGKPHQRRLLVTCDVFPCSAIWYLSGLGGGMYMDMDIDMAGCSRQRSFRSWRRASRRRNTGTGT